MTLRKGSHMKSSLFLTLALMAAWFCFSRDAAASVLEETVVPWGTDDTQVGLLNRPEVERCGPISFCTSATEVLLIDSVNSRVSAHSKGRPARVLARQINGSAICPDGTGGFFLADHGKAVRYLNGIRQKQFGSPSAAQIVEGYGSDLVITKENSVCFANADQKSWRLAESGKPGRFVQPPAAAVTEGQERPQTGLRYVIKRIGGNDVRLIGFDANDKDVVAVRIETDGDPPGAVLFKGTDDAGRLYVEMERLKDGKALLEVHRYSPEGKRLAVFSLPNDYFTTVYKKTEVVPDGSVWQMLPRADGVHLLQYQEP